MEIRDLEFVTRLAEFGHFGRAARDLGVDVSTLSRRVSSIEDDLGVALFERGRGGVRVTAQGRDIIRLAQRALGDVQAIRQRAAQSGAALVGRLRLATERSTLGIRLRAATAAWRKRHPEVQLDLAETESRKALAGIRDRHVDTAILLNSDEVPDLVVLPLWEERLLLAVSKAHRLATEVSVHWSAIKTLPLLVQGRYGDQRYLDVRAKLDGPDLDIRIQHAGSLDLLNLVAIGEGVLLVCEAHREIPFPGVVYLDIDEPDARVPIALVWHPDLEDPVVGSFVAFMRDWCRSAELGTLHDVASRTPDPC
jgi:DNA-binding transcriptional LysR family regulator